MLTLINFLHAYILLNCVIAVCYLTTRVILSLAVFKQDLTQLQYLKLSRTALLATFCLALLMPYGIDQLHFNANSYFHLQPIFMRASAAFLPQPAIIATQPINITHSLPSLDSLITLCLFIGFIIFIGKYIKDVLHIKRILKTTYLQRKFKSIHILFSETSQVPFCWSFLHKSFVVMPCSLLTKSDDLKLALQHELQHIRQGDTYWNHLLIWLKAVCFCNPILWHWRQWLAELQEFSCDESIILHQQSSPSAYGECLLTIARNSLNPSIIPSSAIGIINFAKNHSTSILHRRITMLFNYKKSSAKKISAGIAGAMLVLCAASTTYALNNDMPRGNLSLIQLNTLINQSKNNDLQIIATPEVLTEINNIRSDSQAREYMRNALARMPRYQPTIQKALQERDMPSDLLAMPLAQSGYQPLAASKNPLGAAGIWQIVPQTAENLGLTVNSAKDQRLNTQLATNAALKYLAALHTQFKDWNLALIAYDLGTKNTQALINQAGSHNAWELVRSPYAPAELKTYLPYLSAAVIIMHNPDLVA